MKTYVNRWLDSLNLQIDNLADIQDTMGNCPNDEKKNYLSTKSRRPFRFIDRWRPFLRKLRRMIFFVKFYGGASGNSNKKTVTVR